MDIKKLNKIENLAINLDLISVYDIERHSAIELIYVIAKKMNELIEYYYGMEVELKGEDENLHTIIEGVNADLEELRLEVESMQYGLFGDQVSTASFGIEEGHNVDINLNTQKFQQMIDYCAENNKVIVFPSGDYLIGSLDLGVKNNITIKGASSPFATFAQKDIETGDIIDNYTRIIYAGLGGSTMFNHQSCILILENIAFYNLGKDSNGNFEDNHPAKKCILMQHVRSADAAKNIEKGKCFAMNCGFYGWKVVFGSDYTLQHLEEEWGTGLLASEYEYFKQSCVLATRCRFTRNGVAINQSVDGRFDDCSFNKNDYAIVLRENSGFTTIDGCRIEWNDYIGIYCDGAHEVTVSDCEFDCNGYAGLYAINNTHSNFNGIFRRNGRMLPSAETNPEIKTDHENNVHVYANGNIRCNFIGCNTMAKATLDTGSAPERPSNCMTFTNNIDCIITNNNLTGCTKLDLTDANVFTDNVNCIVDNNLMVKTRVYDDEGKEIY